MAAHFLLMEGTMRQRVKTLSEGQKALLSLACLCLQQPSVLIFDEPTNHVNFRHLPSLANAIRRSVLLGRWCGRRVTHSACTGRPSIYRPGRPIKISVMTRLPFASYVPCPSPARAEALPHLVALRHQILQSSTKQRPNLASRPRLPRPV